MMKLSRWSGVLAALLLAALALAACGIYEDDSDPPMTTTPPAINHDAQTRYSLGDPAPAFALPTADGRTVALADYSGEPVLLFFHMAVG